MQRGRGSGRGKGFVFFSGVWTWEFFRGRSPFAMLSGSGSLCLRMFAVYSFLLCFIFYPTQKPRPCLMCKKQPSATHRFCTGCLRPFEESGVGSRRPGDQETQTRRPSNGPWNVFKLRKQLRVLKLSNASQTRMGMEMWNVKCGTKAAASTPRQWSPTY